jgi:phosphoribosylformylglycinamidine synthase
MWQFAEACRGLKDACVTLGIPVTGGNVSLYNQTGETAILPTPVVAVLGVIDDVRRRTPSAFVGAGERIVLLGETREELSGSEWAHVVHQHLGGTPPQVDLAAERDLARLLGDLVGLATSAHDLSDGGLAQALAEACLVGRVGATVALDGVSDGVSGSAFVGLFSESSARAVVTVRAEQLDDLRALCGRHGVRMTEIGTTGGDALVVEGAFAVPLDELRTAWTSTLPAALGA